MLKNEKFWNKISEKYAKKPVPNEAVYQKKLAITQSYLNQEMSVLEFGCGTGSTALKHAPFVKNYLATDIASNMLNIAQTKLANTNIDNLEFQHISFEDLTAKNQTFDAIIGMSILHLVDNPKLSIQHVYDLLKPNGVFVSSTPCVSGLWKALKLIMPVCVPLGLLPRIHFFSDDDLVSDMTDAGFQIKEHWIPVENKMTSFIVATKPA
jgi:2-polyprenyl-3-methyl-5-hydroxy-6-metoxy-1,4-benzoquinol methylase